MTYQNRPVIDSEHFDAAERAGVEVLKFIDFIQEHNPEVDRVNATLTAGFLLRNLPAFFLKHPELMEQMRAVANKFSQY